MDVDAITDHVLARSHWYRSRASGPGGQHRDHAETRAELVVPRDAVEGLDAAIAERITAALRLERRAARLSSQRDRSVVLNERRVRDRLRERIEDAIRPETPRTPTRPGRAAKERRLRGKSIQSTRKVDRRRVGAEDGG